MRRPSWSSSTPRAVAQAPSRTRKLWEALLPMSRDLTRVNGTVRGLTARVILLIKPQARLIGGPNLTLRRSPAPSSEARPPQARDDRSKAQLPPVKRVLFLCTKNGAGPQMAEGMLRSWAGGRFEALSAGDVPTEVAPLAIKAMAEIGIDISRQRSKAVEAYTGQTFDHVITVGAKVQEGWPSVPGASSREHWELDDPAAATGTEEERLAAFRRARHEIGRHVRRLAKAREISG